MAVAHYQELHINLLKNSLCAQHVTCCLMLRLENWLKEQVLTESQCSVNIYNFQTILRHVFVVVVILCYKDSNVVIVGVIPGPKEPKHDVNSYLGPLVTELLELYTGVWFETSHGRQFIRGVLLCFSSHLPATRKAAGFVGHKGIKGCSRCLKTFTTNSESITDYSGYDRDSWVRRTNELH